MPRAGRGFSTTLADFDFETYSEAGYCFDAEGGRWRKVPGAPSGATSGLSVVGAAVYAEHPTTEVLSMAYDLKDGRGPRLWTPGDPPPLDLFSHLMSGGLLEAWNSGFEYLIWLHVCHKRMGWPELPLRQLRDAMAKSLAMSLPGGLGEAGEVLGASVQKDKEGKRLLDKFSKPRNPTKTDPKLRWPVGQCQDSLALFRYNVTDIQAEASISALLPDLSPHEQAVWLLDQDINIRGVYIDMDAVKACQAVVDLALSHGNDELFGITGGAVASVGQRGALLNFLAGQGFILPTLDAEAVEKALVDYAPARESRGYRALELRAALGSASVKKLSALQLKTSQDSRIRGMFQYCGANRTGRFAGRGPQPQNQPSSGPRMRQCDPVNGCGQFYGAHRDKCPSCGMSELFAASVEWSWRVAEQFLDDVVNIPPGAVADWWGSPLDVVSGCLRGLFTSAPGHDLVSSDYSAIEAVVLAVLAGEQWRIDVFNSHGKIYETSASQMSGIPLDEILRHKKETGEHHPLRKRGKVSELASGYQGGMGAWKNFGADEFMSDQEILDAIRAWRTASPNIVGFWYGLEDAAKSAIMHPGSCFGFRGITYGVLEDVLYCQLPSGRCLSYWRPRLEWDRMPSGKQVQKITYEGRDGPSNKWVRMETYGGKLTENVVQAVARDILVHALLRVDAAGYKVVLHVHDEIVSEIPEGFGSVEEFESLMSEMPPWAAGWPVRASGGWRGKRYRKSS